MELVEYRLGSDARTFVEGRLSEGRTFGIALLGQVRAGKGSFSTYLPPGLDAAVVSRFEAGGALQARGSASATPWGVGVRIQNTDLHLAGLIREHLLIGGPRLCVMEDALRKPDDGATRRLDTKHFFHDAEVYHYLTRDGADLDSILVTVGTARSIPISIGAMCAPPVDPGLRPRSNVSRDHLQALARDATRVFVGAYDGEGYVFWQRERVE